LDDNAGTATVGDDSDDGSSDDAVETRIERDADGSSGADTDTPTGGVNGDDWQSDDSEGRHDAALTTMIDEQKLQVSGHHAAASPADSS